MSLDNSIYLPIAKATTTKQEDSNVVKTKHVFLQVHITRCVLVTLTFLFTYIIKSMERTVSVNLYAYCHILIHLLGERLQVFLHLQVRAKDNKCFDNLGEREQEFLHTTRANENE